MKYIIIIFLLFFSQNLFCQINKFKNKDAINKINKNALTNPIFKEYQNDGIAKNEYYLDKYDPNIIMFTKIDDFIYGKFIMCTRYNNYNYNYISDYFTISIRKQNVVGVGKFLGYDFTKFYTIMNEYDYNVLSISIDNTGNFRKIYINRVIGNEILFREYKINTGILEEPSILKDELNEYFTKEAFNANFRFKN